jgi:hypothetical protein
MGQISIIAGEGREVGFELIRSIACLRKSGIHARSALAKQASVVVWIDDEKILTAVTVLTNSGFEASALKQSDESNQDRRCQSHCPSLGRGARRNDVASLE